MEAQPYKINYAEELNEAQLEAVEYQDGPSLVIAGAGSGKTRVLTYKIAYLLEHGFHPWNILALTFTNKAAREMTVRIGQLVGEERTHDLWAGTFHSIFARILRREAERIGFTSNFTIYDTADSRSLIKAIVREMKLDEKSYKPALVAARISDAKNRLVLPADYLRSTDLAARDQHDNIPLCGKIYETYFERCRTANAMDFDDLLLRMYLLLKNDEEARNNYMRRFQYILVDEYQDTNYAQYRIISLLTTPESRLCVVGDDAQSIYAFRGADIGNILTFSKQYPSMRLIKLERNYRSTKRIVGAANSIIEHNRGRIPKTVYSSEADGEPLTLFEAATDDAERAYVVREIKRLHRSEGFGLDEIAVLYRTNALGRSFEGILHEAGIPYRIYGSLSFYQRKEIKDTIAYLRLAVNPLDEEALLRIINYPLRGIGDKTVQKLKDAALRNAQPLWNVLCDPQHHGVDLNKGTAEKLYAFASLVQTFRERQAKKPVFDMVTEVLQETGIEADIAEGNDVESIARRDNVNSLLSDIRKFEMISRSQNGTKIPTIEDFLPQVALMTDQDQNEDNTPRVTLMTVHAAKGLEYRTVFVTGLEEKLFPNERALFDLKEMEEERRLFYVAVTRAKELCYLTRAKKRWHFFEMVEFQHSRFIDEIDPQYISRSSSFGAEERAYTPRRATRTTWKETLRPSFTQKDLIIPTKFKRVERTATTPAADTGGSDKYDLLPQTRIRHERFGTGTVLSVQGTGPSAKAVIEFDNVGTKTLLLKFAKYEKL